MLREVSIDSLNQSTSNLYNHIDTVLLNYLVYPTAILNTMISRQIISLALVALLVSATCTDVAAFSTRAMTVATTSTCSQIYNAARYQQRSYMHLTATKDGVDTDTILPSFATKEEYTSYMKKAGGLPSGFAVGTATGDFVSVEAPAMGKLPIKATVIHLTEGPTDSWAAVFTSNKV